MMVGNMNVSVIVMNKEQREKLKESIGNIILDYNDHMNRKILPQLVEEILQEVEKVQ